MKKVLAFILVLLMICSLCGCRLSYKELNLGFWTIQVPAILDDGQDGVHEDFSGNGNYNGGHYEDPVDVPPNRHTPDSALEILETVWASYSEDEKFFAMGGGYGNLTDNKPGAIATNDTDTLQYMLRVPEAQLEGVSEAASLLHGMNANTFTAGAFKVNDAAAFTTAMREAIQGNVWMCGYPEQLVIATFGNEFVVVAYGNSTLISNFQAKLFAAYPGGMTLVNEPIL